MIRLRVDEAAAIPLAVESASPVSMTVKEEFIDRGGASIQSNKTATPGTAAVVVTPDSGYDAMAKVTVEAVPQGALSPIDIDFDDSTGAFTAEARVGTSGYIPDSAFVGGGFQLDTQAAATITPTTVQQQAVAAHKYTKGAVVVDPIPSEYIIPSGTKNITANGNAQDVKSYEKVNVSVPNSYSASDEGKVVQSGALVSQSSATYTENGTYDTTLKNEVVVDVQSGGGGATVIASGTFAGNNAYKITVPLGKKMAQTDFVFVMYLPDETEIPYVNDGNSVLITNTYVCIPKQISKIDLSTDNDNIRFKGGYVYNINNAGTITRMNKDGTVAASAEIQGTSSAWGIFGNGTNPGNTMVTMKRDSSGFAMKLNRNAWQSQFKSGFTYNWQVVYIGNDPTNDIVEIP